VIMAQGQELFDWRNGGLQRVIKKKFGLA